MTSIENPVVVAYERLHRQGINLKMQGRLEDGSEPIVVKIGDYDIELPNRSIISLRLWFSPGGVSQVVKLYVATDELHLWPPLMKSYEVRASFQGEGISILWIKPPEGSIHLDKERWKFYRVFR